MLGIASYLLGGAVRGFFFFLKIFSEEKDESKKSVGIAHQETI